MTIKRFIFVLIAPFGLPFIAINHIFKKLVGKDCVALSQMMMFFLAVSIIVEVRASDHVLDIFWGSVVYAVMLWFYRDYKRYIESQGYEEPTEVIAIPIWMVHVVSWILILAFLAWIVIFDMIINFLAQTYKSVTDFIRLEVQGITLISFCNTKGPTKTVWADIKSKVKEKVKVKALNPARVNG